jgi:transcriptional regulator with XRE-family HTH domain
MDAYSKKLGDTIKKYRKNKDYSTKALADKLGVSVGFISHLENGKNNSFKIDLLEKLIDALDIPVQELSPSEKFGIEPIFKGGTKNNVIFSISETETEKSQVMADNLETILNEYLELLMVFNWDQKKIKSITNHIIDEIRFIIKMKDVI